MDILGATDLTGSVAMSDVIISLLLSLVLCGAIGYVYKITHKGSSYTQSFVQTLLMNGMIVSTIMLVVGSSIAKAFSLVGSLSIIRFRNPVKETRDVGFIFFTMAIGMAVGTRFYSLAVLATVVICLVVLIMTRFNWYARPTASQILKIQLPNDAVFDTLFDALFLRYTSTSDLISIDSTHGGMLTELTYSVAMKGQGRVQEFVSEIKTLNGNQRVTLITGYNNTDL